MAKAILVSISNLYGAIATNARTHRSDVLRNTTCCWWSVNAASAQDVTYAFGVVEGRIVSAYSVVASVEDWPVLPQGAEGAGRRAIPVQELKESDWNTATSWTNLGMFGPVRYAEVDLDGAGALAGIRIP
ncbi:MAG TPA: hypothetical protein VIV60_08045 [Polyangiaceae bacterium]